MYANVSILKAVHADEQPLWCTLRDGEMHDAEVCPDSVAITLLLKQPTATKKKKKAKISQ